MPHFFQILKQSLAVRQAEKLLFFDPFQFLFSAECQFLILAPVSRSGTIDTQPNLYAYLSVFRKRTSATSGVNTPLGQGQVTENPVFSALIHHHCVSCVSVYRRYMNYVSVPAHYLLAHQLHLAHNQRYLYAF